MRESCRAMQPTYRRPHDSESIHPLSANPSAAPGQATIRGGRKEPIHPSVIRRQATSPEAAQIVLAPDSPLTSWRRNERLAEGRSALRSRGRQATLVPNIPGARTLIFISLSPRTATTYRRLHRATLGLCETRRNTASFAGRTPTE